MWLFLITLIVLSLILTVFSSRTISFLCLSFFFFCKRYYFSMKSNLLFDINEIFTEKKEGFWLFKFRFKFIFKRKKSDWNQCQLTENIFINFWIQNNEIKPNCFNLRSFCHSILDLRLSKETELVISSCVNFAFKFQCLFNQT